MVVNTMLLTVINPTSCFSSVEPCSGRKVSSRSANSAMQLYRHFIRDHLSPHLWANSCYAPLWNKDTDIVFDSLKPSPGHFSLWRLFWTFLCDVFLHIQLCLLAGTPWHRSMRALPKHPWWVSGLLVAVLPMRETQDRGNLCHFMLLRVLPKTWHWETFTRT